MCDSNELMAVVDVLAHSRHWQTESSCCEHMVLCSHLGYTYKARMQSHGPKITQTKFDVLSYCLVTIAGGRLSGQQLECVSASHRMVRHPVAKKQKTDHCIPSLVVVDCV